MRKLEKQLPHNFCAGKEGGLATFEKAIDNPAGAFIVAAIKGWQEAEVQ